VTRGFIITSLESREHRKHDYSYGAPPSLPLTVSYGKGGSVSAMRSGKGTVMNDRGYSLHFSNRHDLCFT
jgi:hypothetical protein